MNQLPQTPHDGASDQDEIRGSFRPARKPRILIAGEFSAGKTRLINGLLGTDLLPSNVTATALPPIWLVGDRVPAQRVGVDGTSVPLPETGRGLGADLVAGVGSDISDTAFCLVSHPAPILSRVDLIDTPGNSDPNMPAEAWQRMLSHADAVLWCSHAVQAWRQSEKAAFAEMPDELRPGSTLLITQADRLTDEENVRKVYRRVQREAGPMFETIMMVSLIRDEDLARISEHLVSLAARLETLPGAPHPVVAAAVEAAPEAAPPRIRRRVRAVTDILEPSRPAEVRAETPARAAAEPSAEAPARFAGDEDAAEDGAIRPARPVLPMRPTRRKELRVIEGSRDAAPVQESQEAIREALRAEAMAPAPEPAPQARTAPQAPARATPQAPARPAAPPRLPPLLLTRRSQAREIWDRIAAGRTLYEADAVSEALEAYFDEIDREFRRLAAPQGDADFTPAGPRFGAGTDGRDDPSNGF